MISKKTASQAFAIIKEWSDTHDIDFWSIVNLLAKLQKVKGSRSFNESVRLLQKVLSDYLNLSRRNCFH